MNSSTAFNHACKTFFGTPKQGFVCPIIKGRSDGLYELVEPYEVEVCDIGFVVVISIQPGFVFDGASVPRLLWFAAGEPMLPPRVAAALVHDWLYRSQIVPRDKADWYYAQLQAQAGRAYFRIAVEWISLRLCGDAAWKENRVRGLSSDYGTITYIER